MSIPQTQEDLKRWYEEAAQAYERGLSLEQIMEHVEQATQRKITVQSLDLVHLYRPDVQTFNELLLQYPDPYGRKRKPRQVVPDNAIMIHDAPLQAGGSYDLGLQPVGPFCVLEYVTKSSFRKDYEDNRDKYERHLKIPYYLLSYPDNQEFTLYRHNGDRYATVLPNEHGRHAIPELEIEMAILDEWMRFWFRGKLLPLPAELQKELNQALAEAAVAVRRAEDEALRANKAMADVEAERKGRLLLEAELERLRALLNEQGSDPSSS